MSQKYPYDEKDKAVKEAILEIYRKYIVKDDRVELVFEERLGASGKYPVVKCDLYQSTYRTYFYSEKDAKERKNEVPLEFLNDMQRKPINSIDKTSLIIDFGTIHRIVRTKFSPEKLTKMIDEILHERRGEFLGKKTGILESKKIDSMKIVKNFEEFLNESSHEKCSVCGKSVEDKASYADICLSCEDKGYWEDPTGGVHSPDDNDPAAMYEAFTEDEKKITMNNLDWGKTTAERNKNLDKYHSLKTDKEKEDFIKKLKGILSFEDYKRKVKKYVGEPTEQEWNKMYKEYKENPESSLAHYEKNRN